LLSETSSSSEDGSYLDVLLITNAESGKRRIAKIVNFESAVVAAWDNQQSRKVFRMNRSSMQFIEFQFLNSEDYYPSRLCKIQSHFEAFHNRLLCDRFSRVTKSSQMVTYGDRHNVTGFAK
jgi:hypothetical protein